MNGNVTPERLNVSTRNIEQRLLPGITHRLVTIFFLFRRDKVAVKSYIVTNLLTTITKIMFYRKMFLYIFCTICLLNYIDKLIM